MSVKTGVASAAAAYILTTLKTVQVDERDKAKVIAAAFILGWSGQEFLKLLKD